MQVKYRKEKTSAHQRSAGYLLTANSYVLEVADQEIGYYYLAENSHYFIFWDEQGCIQHGLVDLWNKSIRCSSWGGASYNIETQFVDDNCISLNIGDVYCTKLYTCATIAGENSIYQISSYDVGSFSIDHIVNKTNRYIASESGVIHCKPSEVALLFSSFLLLQLSFSIEC